VFFHITLLQPVKLAAGDRWFPKSARIKDLPLLALMRLRERRDKTRHLSFWPLPPAATPERADIRSN